MRLSRIGGMLICLTSSGEVNAQTDAGAAVDGAPEFTPDSDSGFTPGDGGTQTPAPPAAAPIAPAAPGVAPYGALAPGYAPRAAPATPSPVYRPPAFVGPAAQPATASSEPSRARVGDAHLDRVVIQPTAMTQPEGTLYLSTTDIVFLQVGYAFSDSTQLTLTGTPPLGEDAIYPLDLTLKTSVAGHGPVRAALLGSFTGLFGLEEGGAVVGRAGGVVQLCFDRPCETSASLATTALLAGPAVILVPGAGFVWRVAPWAAVLLEADTLMPIGSEASEYHGAAISAGFRLPYRTWALDLTLLRPLGVDEPPEVLPLLTFTYRVLP
ncbi:MAG: hypothetical protein R3B13_05850 [Polyangiaceae bacterium]